MKSLTKKICESCTEDFIKIFDLKNNLQVPKITMVSINVAIKATDSDNKTMSYIATQISNIAGQKAVIVNSKKAISTFKLRKGLPIACKVTLRGKRMYHFLDKLINIALPRIRDFRGLSPKGFNQSSHYSFGIKDHSIFLEVDLDNIVKTFGMNVTIVTNTLDKNKALHLLKKINLPIK
jgi:large subunit ribosomal protein L5